MKREDLARQTRQCADFWLAVTRGGGRWLDCLGVLSLDEFTVSVVRAGGAVETYFLAEVAGCGSCPAGVPWADR